MKKLILRSIIAAAGLVILLIIVFRDRLPFGSSNSSFACDPVRSITRIEFSSSDRKLLLEKKGDGWMVNGNSEARKSGILFIIRILREINIKSPVSAELYDSEIKVKGINPVKVKVFDGWKLLKSFLVYKTGSNIYGNVMKIRSNSKPFIVYVPGFDGEIGSAFTLNELFWQPYTIFNLLPSEIAMVEFENLADTTSSFKISMVNHHSVLSAPGHDLHGWDSTLVTRYLSYFAWVPFEKWELTMREEEKKVIEATAPLYRITVLNSSGKKSVLTMWEKSREEGGKKIKDSDRLYGRTQSSNEFFVLRYFDIDPLIKKRSYFFPE